MLGMIAAIGQNRELGKKGDLIWNLPNDLKFFKETTMGKTVVMGKNTFNSLPRMLPGRKHVILTDNDDFNKDVSACEVIYDKVNLISYVQERAKTQDIYVIGGASMYAMFVNICDFMYLTEIDAEDKEADVYFPRFNKEEWEREIVGKNSDNNICYYHVKYTRK